jgi:hypothetical protein
MYFAIDSPIIGWAIVLGPPTLLLVAATLIWLRGHRWFAGGLAVGTLLWSVFLFWLITEFARGMEHFG